MPHGGGHGGHGGGFHGGGGGFHHHGGFHRHHHHPHTGYYGGGWGAWGWYGPYRRYGYRGWGYSGFGLTIFFVILFVIIVLSIRYTGEQAGANDMYAPGDTRILSQAPTFCERLSIEDAGTSGANLYLLTSKPKLEAKDSFTIQQNGHVLRPDRYYYLSYYLYPGSSFSLSACTVDQTSTQKVFFALVKGGKNFNKWQDDSDDSSHTVKFIQLPYCSSGSANFTNNFSSEDDYYFAFYNDNTFFSSATIDLVLSFNRVLYAVDNATVANKCRFTSFKSCSLPLPLSPAYTALMVVDPPADGDYADNVEIEWTCSARVWMYAIVVIVPSVFVIAVIVAAITICYCMRRRRNTTSTVSSTVVEAPKPVATATGESDPLVNAEAPPAYNPTYPTGEDAYGYGGTQPPPPAYKQ